MFAKATGLRKCFKLEKAKESSTCWKGKPFLAALPVDRSFLRLFWKPESQSEVLQINLVGRKYMKKQVILG
jgi:hypothetical protein